MEFKELIREYYKTIYHISVGYLRNKEDAEDMIQDVFFKYVEHIKEEGEFEDKTHEKYWIIRVTINLCCNKLKTLKKMSNRNLDDNDKKYLLPENALFNEIQKLKDIYKNVVILHYLECYKVSEISQILSISEENVKTRLKRSREKLKNVLNLED